MTMLHPAAPPLPAGAVGRVAWHGAPGAGHDAAEAAAGGGAQVRLLHVCGVIRTSRGMKELPSCPA